jgi:hypothetical protein
MAHDGVYELDLSAPKPSFKHLIKDTTLLGYGESGDISYFDFVRDFSGTGEDEVLTFRKDGFVLYEMKGISKTPESIFLDLRPKYFYRSNYGDNPFWKKFSVRGSYWLQEVISSDFNNDGHRDILFFWEDELDVFFGGSDGKISSDNRKRYRFNELTDKERDEKNTYVTYFVRDINSDGLPDLIFNKFKGAFSSHVSSTKIIIRQRGDSVEGKVIEFEPDRGDWEGGITADLDADGKRELVLVSAGFGVFSILKAVLKGKIDIKFSFYDFRDNDFYSDKEDYSRVISMAFSLRKAQMKGILPTIGADFNSDGLPDVFYANDDDEVRIMINRPGRKFSLNRVEKFKTSVSQDHILSDLDGDGKSEVIFYYKKGSERQKIRILCNNI